MTSPAVLPTVKAIAVCWAWHKNSNADGKTCGLKKGNIMVATTAEGQVADLPAKRLFILSCVALCVTAMTFAIRAGMLNDLGAEFALTKEQLGWTAAMAFVGFPAATVIGGLIYYHFCWWILGFNYFDLLSRICQRCC